MLNLFIADLLHLSETPSLALNDPLTQILKQKKPDIASNQKLRTATKRVQNMTAP